MIDLKRIRKEKNMTQYELSSISGVSQSTICEIENNKSICTVGILCNLCKALGVTPNDLINKKHYK